MKLKYIHIPKTAGTSISSAIGQKLNHKTYRQLMADDALSDCYVFTCVRNPYDRAVSSFYYTRAFIDDAIDRGAVGSHYIGDSQSPDEFWGSVMDDAMWDLYGNLVHHLRPQHKYIESNMAGCVSRRLDCIMRYEFLHQDWLRMMDEFGCRDLGMENVSPNRGGRKWQDLLGAEALSRIAKCYARDFEVLDYDLGDV